VQGPSDDTSVWFHSGAKPCPLEVFGIIALILLRKREEQLS
jgi:hypothetical protein